MPHCCISFSLVVFSHVKKRSKVAKWEIQFSLLHCMCLSVMGKRVGWLALVQTQGIELLWERKPIIYYHDLGGFRPYTKMSSLQKESINYVTWIERYAFFLTVSISQRDGPGQRTRPSPTVDSRTPPSVREDPTPAAWSPSPVSSPFADC